MGVGAWGGINLGGTSIGIIRGTRALAGAGYSSPEPEKPKKKNNFFKWLINLFKKK